MVAAAVSVTQNPKSSSHQNPRPPLLHSEVQNGGSRRPRSREITSRYMSSSTSSSSSSSGNSAASRRSASPLVSRTSNSSNVSTASTMSPSTKRSQSVGPKRPQTSWARKVDSRVCTGVVQVSKSKPTPSPSVRKPTPEKRKPTPPRAVMDHVENSKPWPGRSRHANSMNRSADLTNEKLNGLSGSAVTRALKQSEASDLTDTESGSSGSTSGIQEFGSVDQRGCRGIMVPARIWQETNRRLRRFPDLVSPQSKINNGFKGMVPIVPVVPKKSLIDSPGSISLIRGSSPLRGSTRPASPGKVTKSPLRQMPSPSKARNPAVSTLSSNLSNTPSIFSFGVDVLRGNMGENRVAEAHLLRVLYNRQLQFSFANALADAAMLTQRLAAEKCLYNARITISKLRDYVKGKRKELQFLRQSLKLISILNGQTDIQTVKGAICSAVGVMQAMSSSMCYFQSKVEEMICFLSELANITSTERYLLDQCMDLLSAIATMQVAECSLRTHVLQQKNCVPTGV